MSSAKRERTRACVRACGQLIVGFGFVPDWLTKVALIFLTNHSELKQYIKANRRFFRHSIENCCICIILCIATKIIQPYDDTNLAQHPKTDS